MDRKKRRRTLTGSALRAATVLLLVFATGWSPGRATASDSVFAVVDGEVVSEAQFNDFLIQFARSKFYHQVPKGGLEEVKAEATEALILQRLLVHEAKRRDLSGDPDTVAAQMARYEAKYQGTDSWEIFLDKKPELEAALLERSKVADLEDQVRQVEDPGDEVLHDFYAGNLDLFTEPARSHLSVILIGVPPWENSASWEAAKLVAEDLAAQIAAGADFTELARQHSTHVSADQGGDLGFVHSGMLSAPAQEAIDRITLGQTTPPVKVLEGYTLFRLEGTRPPEVRGFEEVRDRVLKLYQREQSEARWTTFLAGLREKAEIEIPAAGGTAETE